MIYFPLSIRAQTTLPRHRVTKLVMHLKNPFISRRYCNKKNKKKKKAYWECVSVDCCASWVHDILNSVMKIIVSIRLRKSAVDLLIHHLVITTQEGSAFRARWLAVSEEISKYYSPPSSQRDNLARQSLISNNFLLFDRNVLIVLVPVWYIPKQLFAPWKLPTTIYLHFGK